MTPTGMGTAAVVAIVVVVLVFAPLIYKAVLRPDDYAYRRIVGLIRVLKRKDGQRQSRRGLLNLFSRRDS
jgi:hypothetical protein